MSTEIDSVNGPPPLGAEGKDIKHPDPGIKVKNAPADYFHGSVNDELNYWRNRAKTAEARLALRLEEHERDTAKLVVIESPFAAKTVEGLRANRSYLHALIVDSLKRGEYPYASHGFFTNYLDDNNPEERKLGIEAGLAWAKRGGKSIIGTDLGISNGMQLGIDAAKAVGRTVEERSLEGWK